MNTGQFPAVRDADANQVLEAPQRSRASHPSLTMDDRLAHLENTLAREIGEVPNPLRGTKGSGLWAVVGDIAEKINLMAEQVEGLVKEQAADRAAAKALAEQRAADLAAARAPYSRAGWIVATAALSCITTGGIALLANWFVHH